MELPRFQIFGSATSEDVDIMVFVDHIDHDNKFISTQRCEEYNQMLAHLFPNKELNCNLGIIKNGDLIDVYKGTADECQNSLFLTYHNFKQYFPLAVLRLTERNMELKVLRGYRIILSFLSRSANRKEVKKALVSDLRYKILTLKTFNWLQPIDYGKRNVSDADFYKTVVFQILQMVGLMNGVEYYSKELMWNDYPALKPFLQRDPLNYDRQALVDIFWKLFTDTEKHCSHIMDKQETEFY